MNAKRRTRLRDALNMLARVLTIVEEVCEKEQDCQDNYPENLQGTERFESMEFAVDSLNDAVEKLESAQTCIEAAL